MNILIVEDDPVIADVIGMTLEEAGQLVLLRIPLKHLLLNSGTIVLMPCY